MLLYWIISGEIDKEGKVMGNLLDFFWLVLLYYYIIILIITKIYIETLNI